MAYAPDKIDLKILSLLQQSAQRSINEIAEAVGLSNSPCWSRIQKLEEAGYIRARVCVLDGRKLGLKLTGFVHVKASEHDLNWMERFSVVVRERPEVTEFYRITGDWDYLIKVVLPDVEAYDRFYKAVQRKVPLKDVSASFSIEEIKYTTTVPLETPTEGI